MSETPVPYDAGYWSLQAAYEAALDAEQKAKDDVEKANQALHLAKLVRVRVECKLNDATPPPTWSEG